MKTTQMYAILLGAASFVVNMLLARVLYLTAIDPVFSQVSFPFFLMDAAFKVAILSSGLSFVSVSLAICAFPKNNSNEY